MQTSQGMSSFDAVDQPRSPVVWPGSFEMLLRPSAPAPGPKAEVTRGIRPTNATTEHGNTMDLYCHQGLFEPMVASINLHSNTDTDL